MVILDNFPIWAIYLGGVALLLLTAEIGYRTSNGAWLGLLQSNEVEVPPAGPSPVVSDEFMTISMDRPLPGTKGKGAAKARTATKAVGKALGLDLVEVENWNCCGAMEVKNIDPKVQTYLSSRVMSIAANQMGLDTVMAPCNGCYHNLKKAEYDLANDDDSVEVVGKLSKKAGHKTYESGQVETIHALDWIKQTIGEDGLRERVKNSLSGIKVANYYGCMYTRPRHIFPEKDQGPGSESTSKPHFMDDLLAAAGASILAAVIATGIWHDSDLQLPRGKVFQDFFGCVVNSVLVRFRQDMHAFVHDRSSSLRCRFLGTYRQGQFRYISTSISVK